MGCQRGIFFYQLLKLSRKRKRKRASATKKRSGKIKSTDRDNKIVKLNIGSIWRVKTVDQETTTSGKNECVL